MRNSQAWIYPENTNSDTNPDRAIQKSQGLLHTIKAKIQKQSEFN